MGADDLSIPVLSFIVTHVFVHTGVSRPRSPSKILTLIHLMIEMHNANSNTDHAQQRPLLWHRPSLYIPYCLRHYSGHHLLCDHQAEELQEALEEDY